MFQPLTYDGLVHRLPKRPSQSHKGTFGRTLLVGGNAQLGGAIILAAQAAVYAGSGLTTVATDVTNHTALHARLPEAMVSDWSNLAQLKELTQAADVVLLGPGMGLDAFSYQRLHRILDWLKPGQKLVLDGDALTLLARHPHPLPSGVPIVITPHQAEWQRLSDLAIEDQTPQANLAVQKQLGFNLVLKKPGTELYLTDGSCYQLTVGTPAMATGGMGDTLAGMVAAFLAQFPDNFNLALCSAVFLHSYLAQEIAQTQWVVLPHQISEKLPSLMKAFIG